MAISAFHKISQFFFSGKAAVYPLSSNDILVLYGLAAFFQLNSSCYVSQERLRKHIRLSRSAVSRSLQKLNQFGFITIKKHGKQNRYHLLLLE